jgi:Putative zinc-finger
MERAPLRPVPARPAGPIDPATAVREVGAWLPTLPPLTAGALALVVLAERPRAEVADTLGVAEAELGALLASARKELRQTLVVLGGSGWCERAEGLISDRLDGALANRDARRLDVHLRNCTRCVEHERRLVQATDALVAGAGGLARSPALTGDEPPAPLVEAPPPDDSGEEAAAPPGPGAAASNEIAAAAEVLVARRTRHQIATAVVWNSLIALAILLTLATIALTIAGILGAEL